MRKMLIAAALAPTALMLMAAAPVQDVLDTVAAKATELFATKGLTPTGWVSNGALAKGGSTTVSVTLKGGELYSIAGICDNDCSDLNLVLTDSKGNEVDSDVETDDFPLIVTEKTGTYNLTVSMVGCKSASCRYRLLGYKK